MKAIRTPKDGKTICANGQRFSNMEDLHKYASERNMFVSNIETVGVFKMCDLSAYEQDAQLTQSELVNLFIGQ